MWQIKVVLGIWSVGVWMTGYRSACRKIEVVGARCKGRNRKSWKVCMDKNIEVHGLHPEWVVFRDV